MHEVVETFKNHECRVFNNFLEHTIKIGVKGTLCYDACKNLIQGSNSSHHLQILCNIANNDNLAIPAYHEFQFLYGPSTLKHNTLLMHQKLSAHAEVRSDFVKNCMALGWSFGYFPTEWCLFFICFRQSS